MSECTWQCSADKARPCRLHIPYHTCARIGNTRAAVNLNVVGLSQIETVAETSLLYVLALVSRSREAIVNPQERANLHLLVRLAYLCHAIGLKLNNLTRGDIINCFVIKIRERSRLTRSGISSLLLTYY